MIEVYKRIFVGGECACPTCGPQTGFEPAGREFLAEYGEDWPIVHACRSPCHQGAVGCKGNLDSNHPSYLVLESGNDLYLNIIDPPVPLFKPLLFSEELRFAKQHCEAGRPCSFIATGVVRGAEPRAPLLGESPTSFE